MRLMTEKKPYTHTAYAKRREGKTAFRWIEIGMARIETDGTTSHHIYLDRLPLGGFSGHVYLSPVGVKPEVPEGQPERPGQFSEDEEI